MSAIICGLMFGVLLAMQMQQPTRVGVLACAGWAFNCGVEYAYQRSKRWSQE